MARSVKVILEDDLDGGEASQTLTFGFENATYEIDLNDANAEKLRDALAPFITAGRKTSGGRGRGKASGSGSAPSNREETQKIRLWAIDQGKSVNSRGRIPQEIVDAYHAENS